MPIDLKNNIFFRCFIAIFCAVLLFYTLGFMIWTVFNTETGNGDNVEHIHSTWLVFNNKVPYRDFFQHHNPLLWYVFAPFIGFITNQITLLDIAHSIGMITGCMTFFVVYKISVRFFSDKIPTILSILTLCAPYFYIYCFNYNPDTFMALFYAIGLYYLFSYWEESKLFSLVISFFSFFVAFMFTQKILAIYGLLGFLCLYVFYKKHTSISDIAYSLLLPLLVLGVFIAYLYNKDALGIYWQTNYIFNVRMQDYYGDWKINVVDRNVLEPALVLSIISIVCFWNKSSIYFKILSILFVTEAIQRYFYFAIAPYYMLPLMIYSVCINSVAINKILEKKYEFAIIFLMLATYYSYTTKDKYLSARGTDRSFARYIANNVNQCDYVLSSFLGNQSIISKDPHYYWALLGHIDIAGEELGIHQKPNVTQLVLKYKPKFVYGGMYFDNYSKNRGRSIFIQQVDSKVLDTYYLPTPFPDFYLLKYEYQQKNCKYNKDQKDWMYEN